jgi:uncharacterized membrane protein
MPDADLAAFVVGYDDRDVAVFDFEDLQTAARRLHRDDDYEAAVIARTHDGFEVVTTTVKERARETLLGASLGFVVGAVLGPPLVIAAVGAGVGALVGNIVDQFDAFKHAVDMPEVRRLVDDSAASLIVITDDAMRRQLTQSALSRERRIIVPLEPAHLDTLKRELQQLGPRFRFGPC